MNGEGEEEIGSKMELSGDIREKREIEASEARDKTLGLIASVVGLGPAYELITTLILPLHQKKEKEFVQDLATRIYNLEQEGKISIQELADSKEINTTITKAILLAQQNHQKEKLEALKAIVINSAIRIESQNIDDEEVSLFLRIIERMDTTQFLMMKMVGNPHKFLEETGNPKLNNQTDRLATLFLSVFPKYKQKLDLVNQQWVELHSMGLVSTNIFADQFSNHYQTGKSDKITALGERFLEYISTDVIE
ncbi:MAG: hypothetical protein JJ895_12520 [Balneolaceae bacterium]|nr:hypothetical protein [Balneolaceae bacterium]